MRNIPYRSGSHGGVNCGIHRRVRTIRTAIFSSHSYDIEFLDAANLAAGRKHELTYLEARLSAETSALARGFPAVCIFVSDRLDAPALKALASGGTRLIALRSAGYNHVDLDAARALELHVARVPSYSPQSIAEHALTLMLSLDRKIHRAYSRVREGNFSLEGLLGFDLSARTVGIVGTGKIGMALARILSGFGCRLLGADPAPSRDFAACGGRYVPLEELFAQADIVSLHCPLNPQTRHLVNAAAIAMMKPGVMLINTSRGAVVDTRAAIDGLKSNKIAYLGLDVYEEEEALFFEDQSDQPILDDVFARLLTFPNVLITGHQAFFTEEAMEAIATETIANITAFERCGEAVHQICPSRSAERPSAEARG